MSKHNKDLLRYYRDIKRWLPCSHGLKKRILNDIQQTVSGYLTEHPEADMQAIVQRFGTPQQIASTYINEMDTQDLLQHLKQNRKIRNIVIIGLSVLVAAWITALSVIVASGLNSISGYIDPGYITVIEEEEPK